MSQLDLKFFKPFVESTLRVLKVQCNVDSSGEKPFLKGQQPQPTFDIAAVIGVTGAVFSGSIILCFPERVFLKIMSNMLGEPCTTITKDLEDGASELLNIIFGQAKLVLSSQGLVVDQAIPTVIRGSQIQASHSSQAQVMVLPFKTSAGEFHIEIASDKK